MNERKLEELLYKSFDAALTESEAKLLKVGLENSPKLLDEYNRLAEIRSLTAQSAHTVFKPFFEDRVISRIEQLNREENGITGLANSLVFSFKQIGLTALILFVLLFAYNINSGNSRSLKVILGMEDTGIEYYAFDPVQNLLGSK